MCLSNCLDSEDENHSLGLNISTVPSSANNDHRDLLVSAEVLNLSSQSSSCIVPFLDLHYEKHSTPVEHCTNLPVSDNDRQIGFTGQ